MHSLWISSHLCYVIEDAKATELIDEIFRRNSEGKEKEDLLQELEDERLDLLFVKGNTNLLFTNVVKDVLMFVYTLPRIYQCLLIGC